MSDLRRRLDDLKAARPPAAPPLLTPDSAPRTLAEVLSGREVTIGTLAYWHLETAFDTVCPGNAAPPGVFGRLTFATGDDPPIVVDPPRTLILDLETGGFAGMPVFLIGLVLPDRRPLSVVQLLARDYPEEEAIVQALAELAASRDTWVTFNGRSFDEPFLRDRATLHRVRLPVPRVHIDLLHAARRAWRGRVPNFRLVTLEEHILGRPRVGDVPGSDVPDIFHHFIRTGNAAPLRPVLEHNRIDLISATELLVRLAI